MDLDRIRKAIKEKNIDGWLFYDFHHRDLMAYQILSLDSTKFTTRRWFYYIPADGEPVRIVSAVEAKKLDSLPGSKEVYRSWQDLHRILKDMLADADKVAMQYSPENNIPYVSVVDAGTVELIRSFGVTVVSSADLVQTFEAVIDQAGYHAHLEAGEKVQKIKDEAFELVRKKVSEGEPITEYEVQQYIVKRFEEEGLTDDGDHPIVGVNDHPADPHFEPTEENTYTIKKGDTLLIELWAKKNDETGIYYDITWCGYVGENPPGKYVEIFNTVRDARNAARDFIRERFAKNEPCYGYEVDDVCRKVVEDAGYGQYFVHRTGHSIGREVHGNGVHIDNLETKDERQLVPGICFSIEPGIYLPGEMAVRSEINVFITESREVVVAGDEQEELILLV
ncbi:MAG: aminopeptidase P family protein [Candidatus Neomarinimicrobiota bacterium]|nr:MAG: aminopeptidase P family protein [Candidatus Neomarinimicrobiota bacterium]